MGGQEVTFRWALNKNLAAGRVGGQWGGGIHFSKILRRKEVFPNQKAG